MGKQNHERFAADLGVVIVEQRTRRPVERTDRAFLVQNDNAVRCRLKDGVQLINFTLQG
ncbi:hypothetical protein D3C80_2129100 [compost metagenome]